ncbi:polysaccharide deacetylase [Achromobacter sp. Root83]|uniref:polysaccharide deacetylase family protein n=1 Tax=Achromobacter sp. Root83 TaxID=1736602 RepID=UPI0007101F5B|nr:polysaccharide deacetylase family protein [Achromobacter sp. Root83]KRC80505.1 polysaccharide deacetylase [Achromobacter sp. Root83]
MLLPYHDRYPYSPIAARPDYSWPQGKRLAVYLGLNIEHFAFGAGRGHSLGTELPQPDVRGFAWRDYGNRVGVWRLLDLFDELQLPAAHLMNTVIFDYCPQVLEPILKRGDEIIGHGRTNAEAQGHLWPADEARLLTEVREAILEHTGQTVRGWMGPWMSQSHQTPELLVETGYKFVMDWPADDQPLWMRTEAGPLMSVPYPLEINDSPQMLVRRHTAQDFEQMIIEQFEEMLAQSEQQPLVCGIALHTMIVGQPYRLRALRRALKYMAEHPQRHKVWFTRPGEIYNHCASLGSNVLARPM